MRSWKRPVAAIAGITIALELLMVLGGMGPQLVLTTSLSVLVVLGLWFVVELVNADLESPEVPIGPTDAPEARTDRRVMRLRSGLAYARRDDATIEQLRVSLIELVDDQLRAVHQIDRAVDPDAARSILGEDLDAFVNGTDGAVRQLTRPRGLDHIVTLIEKI